MSYGQELILDLVNCNPGSFTRKALENYFIDLCVRINMQREQLNFWDYDDVSPEELEEAKKNPHTYGRSAVQFILTSSIVIHTLPLLNNRCYINIFSCGEFDVETVKMHAIEWFEASIENYTAVTRGALCPSTQ